MKPGNSLNNSVTSQTLTYFLITPARNEEAFIEQTIKSVVSQTVLPRKWVIVSDGSTDKTDDIVRKYMAENSWIHFVRMPEHRDRNFAAKVECFNSGYATIRDEQADVIGNLDADITFDPDHFQFLLSKFAADPKLGVAGTPFVEGETSYDYRFTTIEHVSGACQLFRRECFAEIGGYTKVRGGGIDWIAVTTARMKGWKTRTFVEKFCHHLRPMGTASSGQMAAAFKLGRQDYYLGGHPLWQIFRSGYQTTRPPYLLAGIALLSGYCWAAIRRAQRPVSPELMRFHRHEQMHRLGTSIANLTTRLNLMRSTNSMARGETK